MTIKKRLSATGAVLVGTMAVGYGIGWIVPTYEPHRNELLAVGDQLPGDVQVTARDGTVRELSEWIDETRRTVVFVAIDGCQPCEGKLVSIWQTLESRAETHRFLPIAVGDEYARRLASVTGGELNVLSTKQTDRADLQAWYSPTVYVIEPDRRVLFAGAGSSVVDEVRQHLDTNLNE